MGAVQQAYPKDWKAILTASNQHPPMTVRVNYRQIANGKTEWWAPFWGDEQTAQLWARIREKAGTFTSVHPIGVYEGQKLLDEKTRLIRILTRVPTGNGWFRNLVSITSEEYISMGCKWPIPRRPNGSSATGWR